MFFLTYRKRLTKLSGLDRIDRGFLAMELNKAASKLFSMLSVNSEKKLNELRKWPTA